MKNIFKVYTQINQLKIHLNILQYKLEKSIVKVEYFGFSICSDSDEYYGYKHYLQEHNIKIE